MLRRARIGTLEKPVAEVELEEVELEEVAESMARRLELFEHSISRAKANFAVISNSACSVSARAPVALMFDS